MHRTSIGIDAEGRLNIWIGDIETCDRCGELPEEGEQLVTTSNYEGGDECNILCTVCADES